MRREGRSNLQNRIYALLKGPFKNRPPRDAFSRTSRASLSPNSMVELRIHPTAFTECLDMTLTVSHNIPSLGVTTGLKSERSALSCVPPHPLRSLTHPYSNTTPPAAQPPSNLRRELPSKRHQVYSSLLRDPLQNSRPFLFTSYLILQYSSPARTHRHNVVQYSRCCHRLQDRPPSSRRGASSHRSTSFLRRFF